MGRNCQILSIIFIICYFHYSGEFVITALSSASLSSSTLNHNHSHFLCHHRQSLALLQFKSNFVVDTHASSVCDEYYGVQSAYPKTVSWKEGTDCCSSWNGVTCDAETGHVIEIDLSCSQLLGTIHSNSSLFSSHLAPNLQKLNLAFNDFKASNISSQFGLTFASSLTHLNLSASNFTGSVPSEISLLSKLVSLDLSWNYYPVQLEIGSATTLERIARNLTQLRVLHLNWVDMSTVVLSSASSALMNLSSSLVSLRLFHCGMRGKFPENIFLLPNLQKLDLSSNNFKISTPLPKFNSSSLSNNLELLYLSGISFPASTSFLDSIGNFRSLRQLHLSNCSFTGSIPPSLGNLSKITYLSLSSNQFKGQIPNFLFNMTKLSALYLQNNQLEGPLPSWLLTLPSLRTVNLRNNKLHGPISRSVFKSTNLSNLDLSSNNLTGTLDFDMLFDLKKLRFLNLSCNNLSTSTNHNSNLSWSLPSLWYLGLSSCKLNEFPTFIRALRNLAYLDISNNKIHGEIPNWMSSAGKYTLSFIDLSGNFLTSLGQVSWRNIQTLDLHSNLLQGPLPIPPLTITFYSVSNNSLVGEISSLICDLSLIKHLDLSHNHLTGLIPKCFGNLTSLSILKLRNNNFQGSIPDTFSKKNSFSCIDLNANQVRGPLPQSLVNCQKLEVLDLGNNMIEEIFPYWLIALRRLKVLVLRSNKFNGSLEGFEEDFVFPNLKILDLSNNYLSGRLPTMFIKNLEAMMTINGDGMKYLADTTSRYTYTVTITMKGSVFDIKKILTTFVTIDISKNNFEGEIPEVIGNLVSLKGLNLSHNFFTGYIPPSMGDLVNLEWLDLSSNKLTGKIPQQLLDLTFLAVLNLSQNHLYGSIPQGKQFNTFENGSYKENMGLCGYPLSKACEPNQSQQTFESEESSDFASGYNWTSTLVGYGCGVLFGLYMGYLLFSTRSPEWFVKMIEKKHDWRVMKRSKKNAEISTRRRNRNSQ